MIKPQPMLKETILERLKRDEVSPVPKWQWYCLECLAWSLWVVSILLGAVAVAMLVFALSYGTAALFEATHESMWAFYLDTAPYGWFVSFLILCIVSYWPLQHTKRGYRYPHTTIVGSSVGMSIVLGVVLHYAGFAAWLDPMLNDMPMPIHRSPESIERSLWQQPDAGRLLGTAESGVVDGYVPFMDITDTTWQLNVAELTNEDRQLLAAGQHVRVLGMPPATQGAHTTTTPPTLYACGVFPWLYDEDFSLEDLQAERQVFVERMYAHKDAAARAEALAEATSVAATGTLCAGLDVVRRIGEGMQ